MSADIFYRRIKNRVIGSLAADIKTVTDEGCISGEFLVKLTLEVYSSYCEWFIKTNGKIIDGAEPIRPEEVRELTMSMITEYLRELSATLETPLDLTAESTTQRAGKVPTYQSLLLAIMIMCPCIQSKQYNFDYLMRNVGTPVVTSPLSVDTSLVSPVDPETVSLGATTPKSKKKSFFFKQPADK